MSCWPRPDGCASSKNVRASPSRRQPSILINPCHSDDQSCPWQRTVPVIGCSREDGRKGGRLLRRARSGGHRWTPCRAYPFPDHATAQGGARGRHLPLTWVAWERRKWPAEEKRALIRLARSICSCGRASHWQSASWWARGRTGSSWTTRRSGEERPRQVSAEYEPHRREHAEQDAGGPLAHLGLPPLSNAAVSLSSGPAPPSLGYFPYIS